jgi:hypothetical protein
VGCPKPCEFPLSSVLEKALAASCPANRSRFYDRDAPSHFCRFEVVIIKILEFNALRGPAAVFYACLEGWLQIRRFGFKLLFSIQGQVKRRQANLPSCFQQENLTPKSRPQIYGVLVHGFWQSGLRLDQLVTCCTLLLCSKKMTRRFVCSSADYHFLGSAYSSLGCPELVHNQQPVSNWCSKRTTRRAVRRCVGCSGASFGRWTCCWPSVHRKQPPGSCEPR